MTSDPAVQATPPKPRWRPLAAVDRRVLGVLVEKAKTTPEAYPLSVSALRTGCNQKNNRSPLMEIEPDDVEESLARLRAAGAVTEVQGGGRVARYRHHAYDWLGVEKLELAIMAELLLRGAQTEGELRGRAARMEPIPDLNVLRPALSGLKAKGLVIPLSPEGRGHVVTHALYEPRELEKLRAEFAAAPAAAYASDSPAASASSAPAVRVPEPSGHSTVMPDQDPVAAAELAQLRREIEALRQELAGLRKDVDDLWANLR